MQRRTIDQIKAAAKALDEARPGWYKKVNLTTLKLESCDECILGQVYGLSDKAPDILKYDHEDAFYSHVGAPKPWVNEIKKRLGGRR